MLAAKAGHLNIVKKLITSGARLDITNKVNYWSTSYKHTLHTAASSTCDNAIGRLSVACVATVNSQLPVLELVCIEI